MHFQSAHLWFNLALPAFRRFPLVITIHDPQPHVGDSDSRKTPQWIIDLGYRQADRFIVHGRSLVDVVHSRLKVPRNRVHVVPHIAIGGPPAGETVNDNEDDRMVLFFGRIWAYKGLEYLIRAEPLITQKVPDVRITIAGTGEDLDRYRRLIRHHDRFDIYNDRISDTARTTLFRQAAVVVLPYISATQSGVVPVAYSHGKPVVATRVGALEEYVDNEKTGLLVPPRDEKALAEAIISLLLDPIQRRQMGKNARKKVLTDLSAENVTKKTAEVYRLAIQDHRFC
jgi:glycosyltransferase involved in cell wall biosynthesis